MSSPDEHPLTDEHFIPRNESDLIEELRAFIRRRLAAGATQWEVETELTQQGLDPLYATQLVSSVITTATGPVELGTEWFVGGVSTGYLSNPVAERKLRQMARRRREERVAREGPSEPLPDFDLGATTSPDEERARFARAQRWRIVFVFGFFGLLAVLGVWYVYSR